MCPENTRVVEPPFLDDDNDEVDGATTVAFMKAP